MSNGNDPKALASDTAACAQRPILHRAMLHRSAQGGEAALLQVLDVKGVEDGKVVGDAHFPHTLPIWPQSARSDPKVEVSRHTISNAAMRKGCPSELQG